MREKPTRRLSPDFCNYRLITLWPIDRLRPVSHSAGNFLIGDVMLGSEDISASLTDAAAPIVLDPSGTVLAPDFKDFLADLATGDT